MTPHTYKIYKRIGGSRKVQYQDMPVLNSAGEPLIYCTAFDAYNVAIELSRDGGLYWTMQDDKAYMYFKGGEVLMR